MFRSIKWIGETKDARGFARACGAAWGLSWVIHSLVLLAAERGVAASEWRCAVGLMLLPALALPFVMPYWLELGARTFHHLAGPSLSGNPPVSLSYDLFAYALGPSILACVPLGGPPVAMVWIVGLMILGARKREAVPLREAVACTFMAAAACLIVCLPVGAILWIGWDHVLFGA